MTQQNAQFVNDAILNAFRNDKTTKKYLTILNSGEISNSQINALKTFIKGNPMAEQLVSDCLEQSEGINLTQEQNQKGAAWINKNRKHLPFGYRENEIWDNFSHFTLHSFHNAGNMYMDFFVPVYSVVSKDGQSFEYYVNGGKMIIAG